MITREEILPMPAGRELDALVAEQVMDRLVTWNRVFQYLTDEERKTDMREFVSIPEYSTDIAAAWEVVEKMHGNGCGLSLEYFPEDLEWYADFDELTLNSGCLARSVPLAIVKAALLSLLKED